VIITSDFEVAEPVERVWRFFDDIPQVASCLPGAELTKDLGDDKYEGRVAIRMGPVRLQFTGTADITERDEAAKRIVVHAAGADEKGRGQAAMVGATLSPKGRATLVSVSQDLQLSGAAAQYGRGMISDFSAILMRDFSANMQDRIERLDRGETAEQIAAAGGAASAQGFTIALRAARMALTRVFRRFFLPYQPPVLSSTGS
jgi:carbon monoxide dehydrogenase subunit G